MVEIGEEWGLLAIRSLSEISSVSGITKNVEEEEEEEEIRFKVVVVWFEGVILLVLPVLGRAGGCRWWWCFMVFICVRERGRACDEENGKGSE